MSTIHPIVPVKPGTKNASMFELGYWAYYHGLPLHEYPEGIKRESDDARYHRRGWLMAQSDDKRKKKNPHRED